ncbi:MAG TPA: tetratricopeptide repeat protein [Caulobacteraceae bacterium]|jgi:Flp pilus assembly protein TadD|nr:tetratricopeptide repeat protein [Caulobacteraceae bacterium]
MPFKRVLLATALTLIAAPALAAPAAAPPARPAPATPAKPVPPPAPTKASAEQRAVVERLGPLARASFWARETQVDPADNEARLKLAQALRALGKFEEAGANADQVLVMEPNNYQALLESARDRIAQNQGFYGIDKAQRAEALQPNDWRPVALLAVCLEQSERDNEALAAHRKALALAPNSAATLSNLGMYYATHGDPTQAEALLRRAVSAPGAGIQERQNLALVLGMEGRIAEAEQIERQDLPPQTVDNNLAYLRAANGEAGSERTWDSVRSAQ